MPLTTPPNEPAEVGHNSGFAAQELTRVVERIERLEEEKQALVEDIREVYLEAKHKGFDAAILRRAIRLRKMDPKEREEQEAVLDLYMAALEGK